LTSGKLEVGVNKLPSHATTKTVTEPSDFYDESSEEENEADMTVIRQRKQEFYKQVDQEEFF
jgi:hypothetical protein